MARTEANWRLYCDVYGINGLNYTSSHPYKITYVSKAGYLDNSPYGTPDWPTDGTSAISNGKPGEGGAGGTLISSYNASGLLTNAGGACGQPAIEPGRNIYWGGAAGRPTHSVHVHFWFSFPYDNYQEGPSHVSIPGTDAPVVRANQGAGPSGGSTFLPSPFAWVHPLLLRKTLNHAKDDYLENRIAEAEARLTNYVGVLEARAALGQNPQNDEERRREYELKQIYNEMQILLARMKAGLDYFGNPKGWVPLLSFEVLLNIYKQEINDSSRSLYLAYWMQNKITNEVSKVEALQAARTRLTDELGQARTSYNVAVTNVIALEYQARHLNTEITNVYYELQLREKNSWTRPGRQSG